MASSERKTGNEYEQLRNMIINSEILPNERIVEAEYAEKLDTNRANIRNALARLEQEGLVVIEPFRGARVRLISETEAVEIFEVRGAVEVLLVRKATEQATDSDKEELKLLLAKVQACLADNDALGVSGAGRRLREVLWRISENETATRVLSSLNTQLVRFWFQSVVISNRAEAITEDLKSIVEAVCNGDADNAVRAMQKYHEGAVSALTKAFSHKITRI